MSKSEMLYVKGMNSESDGDDDGDQDIWDDRKINDAYDKAMKVANAEVAKRLAMATNSQHGNKDAKKNKMKPSSHQKSSKPLIDRPETSWKVGMPCRAVYTDDGLEYEALVVRIISNNECVVQFLGYDNLEIKQTNTLKQSQGKEARTLQIEMALTETGDPEHRDTDNMDVESQRAPSPGSTERSFPRKRRSKKKSNPQMPSSHFQLPDITMPNMNMFKNLSSMEMPLPPPISMTASSVDSEEQAVSSMLLSWYMSGYYTGLYQGLKRAKENRRSN